MTAQTIIVQGAQAPERLNRPVKPAVLHAFSLCPAIPTDPPIDGYGGAVTATGEDGPAKKTINRSPLDQPAQDGAGSEDCLQSGSKLTKIRGYDGKISSVGLMSIGDVAANNPAPTVGAAAGALAGGYFLGSRLAGAAATLGYAMGAMSGTYAGSVLGGIAGGSIGTLIGVNKVNKLALAGLALSMGLVGATIGGITGAAAGAKIGMVCAQAGAYAGAAAVGGIMGALLAKSLVTK